MLHEMVLKNEVVPCWWQQGLPCAQRSPASRLSAGDRASPRPPHTQAPAARASARLHRRRSAPGTGQPPHQPRPANVAHKQKSEITSCLNQAQHLSGRWTMPMACSGTCCLRFWAALQETLSSRNQPSCHINPSLHNRHGQHQQLILEQILPKLAHSL